MKLSELPDPNQISGETYLISDDLELLIEAGRILGSKGWLWHRSGKSSPVDESWPPRHLKSGYSIHLYLDGDFTVTSLRFLKKAMVLVRDSAVSNPSFCFCNSKNVVPSSALGKGFLYCRGCGKERKS